MIPMHTTENISNPFIDIFSPNSCDRRFTKCDTVYMVMTDVEKFLSTRGFLPLTQEGYRSVLLGFDQFLQSVNMDMDLINSPEIIVSWLAGHPGWGDCQRHKALAALRSYTRWRYGHLHPIMEYRMRSPSIKPQRTLNQSQVTKLLDSIDCIRDYAVVSLLVDTGLRKAEVCRLLLDQVDLEARSLQVQIKGGSWGQGVFSEATRDSLEDWIKIRADYARPDTKTLFCSLGGNTPGKPLTPCGMTGVFRIISARAGFTVSPHDLRRTMASILTTNGAPTELVRKAGRWKSIDQVTRYTQAVPVGTITQYLPLAERE